MCSFQQFHLYFIQISKAINQHQINQKTNSTFYLYPSNKQKNYNQLYAQSHKPDIENPFSKLMTLIQTQPHLQRPTKFRRHQRLVAFTVMLLFQTPFFITLGIFAYSVITWNYHIWIMFAVISLIQYPVTRCQTFIDFVNYAVNPLLYFKSFKRIFEQPVPQDKNKCMFAFHPHSVFAYGLLANMNYHNNDAMSRMSGLSSRFMLNMPITGLLLRLWGVQAVDPQNLKRLMTDSRNIGLLPGGFEQATLTTSKQLRIFIENRKGFIKYALKFNYTLYPTLVLNEHQVFWTFDYLLQLRMAINRIKMPGVLFFHPKSFIFYPSDVEFITVVGRGLKGKDYGNGEEPSGEEIEDMHKKYIAQVKRVYEKHRDKNGDKPLIMF